MDYASLTAPKGSPGSIAEWTNYAPLAGAAPEIVKNAQDELFARLRVREMRKSLTLQLGQGIATSPVPADFLDAAMLQDPYGSKIKRISDDRLIAERFYDQNSNLVTGYPSAYGIFDGAFQFDFAAIQPMVLRGLYYGATYIAPAAGQVPAVATNVLTTRYTHLFRGMLLKHAYAYRKDWDAAAKYAAQVEANLQDVEAGDDLAYRDLDDADMGARL